MADNVNQFLVNESPFLEAVDNASELGVKITKEEPYELGDGEVSDAGDAEADDEGDDTGGAEEASEEAGESDDGESEEDEEESDEEEEEESDEEESEGEQKEEVKPKLYTATLEDGTQVKVPDNATIKLKVDGKFQRIPVKDLASGYNGQVKYDELIRRSSETQKELEQRLEASELKAGRARELTKNFTEAIADKGDLIEAMSVIAEMTDHENPEELLQTFMNGLSKAIDDVVNLSPEEIEKKARAYKLNSELSKKEAKIKAHEAEEQRKAAIARRQELEQEYSLEPTEMQGAYEALANRNQILQKEGKKPIDFTLEDVAELAVDHRHNTAIRGLLEQHEISLEVADIQRLIQSSNLVMDRYGRYPKPEEYRQLVSQYVTKELEDLSRKVGSPKKKTTPKSKKKKTTQKKAAVRDTDIWGL